MRNLTYLYVFSCICSFSPVFVQSQLLTHCRASRSFLFDPLMSFFGLFSFDCPPTADQPRHYITNSDVSLFSPASHIASLHNRTGTKRLWIDVWSYTALCWFDFGYTIALLSIFTEPVEVHNRPPQNPFGSVTHWGCALRDALWLSPFLFFSPLLQTKRKRVNTRE